MSEENQEEKKVRALEIELVKSNERYQMFKDEVYKHFEQCPVSKYIEELERRLTSIEDSQEDDYDKLETTINNFRNSMEDKFKNFNDTVASTNEQNKNHFYKVIGGIVGILTLIFTILFTMNSDKVSYPVFNDTVKSLQDTIEKQSEVNNKMFALVSDLKVDIGIIKNSINNSNRIEIEHEYKKIKD